MSSLKPIVPETSNLHVTRFEPLVAPKVLLAELPTPRRGELHLQVAQALEAMHAGHLAPIVPALALTAASVAKSFAWYCTTSAVSTPYDALVALMLFW